MKKKLLAMAFAALVSMAFCHSAFSDNPPKAEYDDNRQQTGWAPFAEFSKWSRVSTSGIYFVYLLNENNTVLDMSVEYLDPSVEIPVLPNFRIKIQLITPIDN